MSIPLGLAYFVPPGWWRFANRVGLDPGLHADNYPLYPLFDPNDGL